MFAPGSLPSKIATRSARRLLVGSRQEWLFSPANGYRPPPVERTSLYIHLPFCRNACPYCPYTTVAYREEAVSEYARALVAEVDAWADAIGPATLTSIYIGGGTPTLALDAVESALARARRRFSVCGPTCIETNPADISPGIIERLRALGVTQVSLGVQSFSQACLDAIGRTYEPNAAESALRALSSAGFDSVNTDLMFAVPGQAAKEVVADLDRAKEAGANQVTCYPLFTFPYTEVGRYLKLGGVGMPGLAARKSQYESICRWADSNGFERVSVWGFARSGPKYSSVTRDGYVGIGLGTGSHLPDGFVLNTFDMGAYVQRLRTGVLPMSLRMAFTPAMSAWWWFYWRLYDTRIPLGELDLAMGDQAPKARALLGAARAAGFAVLEGTETAVLTRPGSFWMHLGQNHFALSYVATLWSAGRGQPWPGAVAV